MADINWRRIEDLPEELKDGRDVLLYETGTYIAVWDARRGLWCTTETNAMYQESIYLDDQPPTYFAAIEEPDDG